MCASESAKGRTTLYYCDHQSMIRTESLKSKKQIQNVLGTQKKTYSLIALPSQ